LLVVRKHALFCLFQGQTGILIQLPALDLPHTSPMTTKMKMTKRRAKQNTLPHGVPLQC